MTYTKEQSTLDAMLVVGFLDRIEDLTYSIAVGVAAVMIDHCGWEISEEEVDVVFENVIERLA